MRWLTVSASLAVQPAPMPGGRGTAVTLTNDESRKVADALRAADLRLPYDSPT
jgi:hypothetical protein